VEKWLSATTEESRKFIDRYYIRILSKVKNCCLLKSQ